VGVDREIGKGIQGVEGEVYKRTSASSAGFRRM